jgi:hypothetical protein
MKGLSLCRPISIEDIAELTPRKGAVIRHIKMNKPPQLEEVDERIGQLVDLLAILDQSLSRLEEQYFQELPDEDSPISEAAPDETWTALHQGYSQEIDDKDSEYEKLIQRFPIKSV